MKAVMKSVSPRICEKVASGDCTILVSKTAPKCELPFKCYIYCTKAKKQDDIIWAGVCGDRGTWNEHIIGEFVCDKIEDFKCASVPYKKENNLGYGHFVDNGVYKVNGWFEGVVFERNDKYIDTMLKNKELSEMCLSAQQLFDYIGIGKHLYAWHISDLKIYDFPLTLDAFNLGKTPTSWRYV